jgi:hypothetical protein
VPRLRVLLVERVLPDDGGTQIFSFQQVIPLSMVVCVKAGCRSARKRKGRGTSNICLSAYVLVCLLHSMCLLRPFRFILPSLQVVGYLFELFFIHFAVFVREYPRFVRYDKYTLIVRAVLLMVLRCVQRVGVNGFVIYLRDVVTVVFAFVLVPRYPASSEDLNLY